MLQTFSESSCGFSDMNAQNDYHSCYSPIRAKRRQSDAKWRASVAACYNALKYVVPNMKQMSKRKVSKAFILQESEKHIQQLENQITNMIEVECPAQGRAPLWQDGMHWTSCTLDKLREDFSAQQKKVFHSASQGRRCYNLLQDIKEEVFSMQADPKQLAFVAENVSISSLNKHKGPSDQQQSRQQCTRYKLSGVELKLYGSEDRKQKQKNIRLSKVNEDLQVVPTSSFNPDSSYKMNTECLDHKEINNVSTSCYQDYFNDFSPVKVEYCNTVPHNAAIGEFDVGVDQEVPFQYTPTLLKERYQRSDNCGEKESLVTKKEISVFSDVVGNIHRKKFSAPTAAPGKYDVFKLKHIGKQSVTQEDTVTGRYHTSVKDGDENLETPTRNFNTPSARTWSVNKALFRTGNAKKKLNFNSPPKKRDSPARAGMLKSPDFKSKPSPMISGFTPIKLPDLKPPTSSEEDSLVPLISPWKGIQSTNTRPSAEGYIESPGIDDSLLCFESLDTMELDEFSNQKTPSYNTKPHKTEEPEMTSKIKRSPNRSWVDSQPRCRKRLERLYEKSIDSNECDSHTVPQLGSDLSNKKCDFTDELAVDNYDFDGFLYYYHQVGPKLSEKLGSTSLHSPTVAYNVAHMWRTLPQHDRNTMTTLANLEGQKRANTGNFGKLSQDLEDIEVEPLDPQDFIPNHMM